MMKKYNNGFIKQTRLSKAKFEAMLEWASLKRSVCKDMTDEEERAFLNTSEEFIQEYIDTILPVKLLKESHDNS